MKKYLILTKNGGFMEIEKEPEESKDEILKYIIKNEIRRNGIIEKDYIIEKYLLFNNEKVTTFNIHENHFVSKDTMHFTGKVSFVISKEKMNEFDKLKEAINLLKFSGFIHESEGYIEDTKEYRIVGPKMNGPKNMYEISKNSMLGDTFADMLLNLIKIGFDFKLTKYSILEVFNSIEIKDIT